MPLPSSPDSQNPDKALEKVDITFVMANWKCALVGENWLYTSALQDSNISYKNFRGIDIPEWFQTATIQDLMQRTRIIAIDCVMAGPPTLLENGWLTTWLRLAEEIRIEHPDLPIWLLEPVDDEGDYDVETRTEAAWIDSISLLNTFPGEFSEKIQQLLCKRPADQSLRDWNRYLKGIEESWRGLYW